MEFPIPYGQLTQAEKEHFVIYTKHAASGKCFYVHLPPVTGAPKVHCVAFLDSGIPKATTYHLVTIQRYFREGTWVRLPF